MPPEAACPLCVDAGGELVWRDDRLRVILADEPLYPGFTRLVWNAHVAELSDLAEVDRARLMDVLVRIERVMRAVLAPAKVNLASLGNQVPHMHWHLVPRWPDDPHFPLAVWAPTDPERVAAAQARRDAVAARLPDYRQALRQALAPAAGSRGQAGPG